MADGQNFSALSSVPAINLNFHVHGTLVAAIDYFPPYGSGESSYSQAQAGFGVLNADSGRSLGSGQWVLYNSYLDRAVRNGPAIVTKNINTQVQARLELNNGLGRYMASVNTMAYSNDGYAHANLFETITLSSITLDDGSTPESKGYVLQFASGRLSPNLAAVPEPATIMLWGLGAAGVATIRYRRTKRRLKAV